jgi:hypothetical protein
MSAAQGNGGNGGKAKAWLQEFKANRKTQAAFALFVLVLSYLGYELFAPSAGTQKKKSAAPVRSVMGQPLDDSQAMALQKLPNLAGLDKAGELPSENRMYRDLFVFDAPPPQPKPAPPPPKQVVAEVVPPTPEELAAAARKAAMDRETRSQPSDYKFIAIVQAYDGPRNGTFQKGDDIRFIQVGDEVTPNWKLVSLTDEEAKFENTKYNELKCTIRAQTAAADRSSGQTQQVTNFF